jgi:hypothetical protein
MREMPHRQAVRELCAGSLQCAQVSRESLSCNPPRIAVTLEHEQIAIGKLRDRWFDSRIAADLQRRGKLIKIARDGVALKRERHRVISVAHQ